ncbi:hypothetical protein [Nocardia sp. NPDC052112]|uniref:hypothetical protein n=1 Tax=Nocardia sp. NPDC052112 TaxID=3155646 RepID=UPI00344366AD
MLSTENCRTLAEHAGDRSPDAVQHLLSGAVIDEDGLRDDLRWSFVRYRAVRAGKLAHSAVAADFLVLGQDGALEPQLGLLSLMK